MWKNQILGVNLPQELILPLGIMAALSVHKRAAEYHREFAVQQSLRIAGWQKLRGNQDGINANLRAASLFVKGHPHRCLETCAVGTGADALSFRAGEPHAEAVFKH